MNNSLINVGFFCDKITKRNNHYGRKESAN